MAKVSAGMIMSLDGFVADSSGSLDALYPDMDALHQSEMLKESIKNTGAVVMGKRAFDMGDPDWFANNYEYQVPLFVLTHTIPEHKPKQTDKLTITFVTTGIESAISQAKAAAGHKEVTVIGGAHTIQQIIASKLFDELHIGIAPIILGSGLKLFQSSKIPVVLKRVRVIESPGWTDIFYQPVQERCV